ncbi:MAG: hypothetical protein J2P31_13530, partial [Blastocatellia bacterium]|nr:hypothetical protein [Blastocatellia bacterium]
MIVIVSSLIILLGPWNKPKGTGIAFADFYKPSRLLQNLSENIKLGLDLKGGTHLVMQVQTEEVIKTITENNREKAADELKKAGIPFKEVTAPANGLIVVTTADASKHSEIEEKVLPYFGTNDWDVSPSSNPPSVTFKLKNSAADRIRNEATETAKT